MFALYQELRCDVPRWLHLTGLLVLLMELFDPLFSGHQLHEVRKGKDQRQGQGDNLWFLMLKHRDLGSPC